VTVTGDSEAGVKPATLGGSIVLVSPFRVLTGDWYHFRDQANSLPADLQGSLQLLQGDKSATTIDPERDETASGFGRGALCMGESNGGLTLALSDGLLEMKANLFFTGGRKFKISYTLADGTTKSITTEKYSKGSYADYDILANAGLTDEAARLQVRSITFQQDGANGGARMYDLYVKVPDSTATGISTLQSTRGSKSADSPALKLMQGRRLVIVRGGMRYNAQGQQIQ
jgi:hypothetical protein